ncbi:LacI family transcriptional regulator [Salinibacterium sp. NYA9b]
MRTTRVTAAFAALAVTISLAACTTTTVPEADGTDIEWVGAGKEVSELVFATNVKSMGFDWFKRMEIGVLQFGTDTGVTAFEQGPSTADPALQVQVAQDQLAQGIDALIVVPTEVASMEPVMKQAMAEGVVVVTHEASNVENAVYNVEAFDNTAYGEHLMDELAALSGETGDFAVFVGSLDSTAQNEWMDAAIAHGEANYPDMKLVGDRQVTGSDQNTSYAQMKQLIATYPNLKGIIGGDALDVVGAGQAVEEAGLQDAVSVLGTSIVSYAGDLLKTGAIDLVTTWDPADAGYAANKVALMVLQGEEIAEGTDLGVAGFESITLDGKVITGSAWVNITAENMADYNF